MRITKRWPLRRSIGFGALACAVVALSVVPVPWVPAPRAEAAPAVGLAWAAAGGLNLRDGVVVDPLRSVAYLMNAEGHLEAVGLAGGAVLWKSTEAARPLAAADGKLVAQAAPGRAGVLELVVLDAGSGERLAASSLALPDGVWASIQDGPGRSFRARAQAADQAVTVDWAATRRGRDEPLQGYLPAAEEQAAPQVAARAARQLAGSARLDLATGQATSLLGQKAAVAPRPALDLLAADELPGVAGRRYVSADGRHVLASTAAPGEGAPPLYRWAIFDRTTGEHLGTVTERAPTAPFLVVGTTLLYEAGPSLWRRDGGWADQDLALRAASLETGSPLWEKAILDSEFRGPFPP